MKKITTGFLVLLAICSLSLTLIPGVLSQSQTQNVKVESYSYYIDALGLLVVVGEVQNTGPNTVTTVILTGSILASDGTDQSDSYTPIGVPPTAIGYLNPQQKAPFYMDFYAPNNSPDGTWASADISKINLVVAQANATTRYQYPDLNIPSSSASIGSTSNDRGVYWVTGNVQNTGTQSAQNITVFGTFYNETGHVVAVGFSNQIGTLSPSGTGSFKLGAFDLNQTQIPSSKKITDYTLLIQALSPINTQGTPPTITPYPSPGSTQIPTATTSPTGSTSPTQGSPSNPNDSLLSTQSIYAIVIVIAIVVVAITLLLLKKRVRPSK